MKCFLLLVAIFALSESHPEPSKFNFPGLKSFQIDIDSNGVNKKIKISSEGELTNEINQYNSDNENPYEYILSKIKKLVSKGKISEQFYYDVYDLYNRFYSENNPSSQIEPTYDQSYNNIPQQQRYQYVKEGPESYPTDWPVYKPEYPIREPFMPSPYFFQPY